MPNLDLPNTTAEWNVMKNGVQAMGTALDKRAPNYAQFTPEQAEAVAATDQVVIAARELKAKMEAIPWL